MLLTQEQQSSTNCQVIDRWQMGYEILGKSAGLGLANCTFANPAVGLVVASNEGIWLWLKLRYLGVLFKSIALLRIEWRSGCSHTSQYALLEPSRPASVI